MIDRWSSEGEVFLYYDVQKVLSRYARGVDRKDWDLILSAFHEDAIDDHGSTRGTPGQFVEHLRVGHEYVIGSMHLNGNISLLDIDRDRREVLVETYCVGWQRLTADAPVPPPLFVTAQLGADKGMSRLLAVGNRYLDLFSERNGDLRIARRTVIYEWIHVESSDDQPQFAGRTLAERSINDVTYTTLADFRDASDANRS
jgi:hypothetical protein